MTTTICDDINKQTKYILNPHPYSKTIPLFQMELFDKVEGIIKLCNYKIVKEVMLV